jgi:plasmid rolling circle replication initiator protein Rep
MSDCVSDGHGAVSSLPCTSDSSNSTPVALSEVSPRDKLWDKHRSNADKVAALYASGGTEFRNYADRVTFCSELLRFGLILGDDEALHLKLRAARFCRVRHCPVCQWRRSLMWKARAYKVLPKIVEAYPTHRWLFLTLTQKNVPIAELKQTLVDMNRAFQRLSQLRLFPAVGWLRSTEVTRGRDASAHPHFHCLLMVSSSYFGKNYIRQSEWVEMWRKSLRLNYNPILDVQAVKQGDQPMDLVPEILKYCTKESDLVADKEWFLELTRQMHKMKCVTTGGVLKQYLKELEEEPEDLIGESDQTEEQTEASVCFGWKRKEKRYRMVEHD